MHRQAAFFHLEPQIGSCVAIDGNATVLHAVTNEIELLRTVVDDNIRRIVAVDVEQGIHTILVLSALEFNGSDVRQGFP